MMTVFLQHLDQWWNELGMSGRLALLAVALGGSIVLATTWVGIRQWWHRWKQES